MAVTISKKELDGSGPKLTQANFPNTNYRPNRVQTLTPEYEITLKQFWANFLGFTGYDINIKDAELSLAESYVVSSTVAARKPEKVTPKPTNTGRGFFGYGGGGASEPAASEPKTGRAATIKNGTSNEKYQPIQIPAQYWYTYLVHHDEVSKASNIFGDSGENELIEIHRMKEELAAIMKNSNTSGKKLSCKPKTSIHSSFAKANPEVFHATCCQSSRADPLDNYCLKLIRARKANLDKALLLLAGDMQWRFDNENTKLLYESDGEFYLKKNGKDHGVIKNFNARKLWIRGHDRENSLLFCYKVERHFGSESSQEDMRKWLLLQIEWGRLLLKEIRTGNDRVTIFFDLSGFGLKNADYSTIKFMAEVFEAHLPEVLGYIIIYNAPWIFSTFWNVIKGWLDPDVAGKIRFMKSMDEVSNYIDLSHIPKSMGGQNNFDGEYEVPEKEFDLHPLKRKDERYFRLIKERHILALTFFERTAKWIETTDPELSSYYLQDKIDTTIQLAQNYVDIDPYIRRRGLYDRNGLLKVGL